MSDDQSALETPQTRGGSRIAVSATLIDQLRHAGFVLALAAAAFLWLDDRFGWLTYQPGGTAFFTYVRPVAFVLLTLGGLLALKWELAGGVVAGFAAGAIGAFAVNQLIGRHAVVVIVLIALPGAIWSAVDLLGWSHRRAAFGLAAAVMATAAGAGVGEFVYERQFGPTHEESDAVLADSPVRWVWAGGVTTTDAAFRARVDVPANATIRLDVRPAGSDDERAEAMLLQPVDRDDDVIEFATEALVPDTEYRYALEIDGELDTGRVGRLRTFPSGPASFGFTVGACARVGSNGAVFDAIGAEQPLFHLIAGDFHYGDIPDDDRDRYDEVIDLTLRQPAQSELYRSTPIAYVWDDHDYGVNDSDASSASRAAAMAAYRSNVPSYPLAGEQSALYQQFDVGRVRFLLTDARSSRDPGVSMLGDEQLTWFLDALVAGSREQELVVWLNPVPWVADASDGADHWGGFADERERIANVIAEHDIDGLLMVSGDAHMVAIDDGSNTDFSTDGGAGFPLIHAAALDRPGGTKGGPYSHGVVGGSGQFAVVEVRDDGDRISVGLRAKRWDGETLLSYDYEVGGPDRV